MRIVRTDYPAPTSDITVGSEGRYVRIQLNGTNFLAMNQVEVFAADIDFREGFSVKTGDIDGNGTDDPIVIGAKGEIYYTTDGNQWHFGDFPVFNGALDKPTRQSSTYQSASSDIAVDGSTETESFASTNKDANAWWEVDLGRNYTIDQVNVYGRTGGPTCNAACVDRLNRYYLFTSDDAYLDSSYQEILGDPSVEKMYFIFPESSDNPVSYRPPKNRFGRLGKQGRHVRIQLSGTNFLSLAEVEVLVRDLPLKSAITGDFNGDGKSDLAALGSSGRFYVSTDWVNWTVNSTGFTELFNAGDLDGDGVDDLFGVDGEGKVSYSLNSSASLPNWTGIPGMTVPGKDGMVWSDRPDGYVLAWNDSKETLTVYDPFTQQSESFEIQPTSPPDFPTEDIDDLIVYPDDLPPTDRSVETVSPAGAVGGSFAVDANGQANYSIPIEVPPGVNGVQPSLAISYNSKSGNGLLGVGWNLSGLSAISRCGQTVALDDKKTGVQMNREDRFCISGSRLVVLNSDTYGDPGTQYRTIPDSEIVATASSYSCPAAGETSGPCSFTVRTGSGSLVEYGTSANSRIVTESGAVYKWLVNKITDKNGNTMTVTWNNIVDPVSQEVSYNPARIDYTGHTSGIAPQRTVTFEYDDSRKDVIERYIVGIKLAIRDRLHSVRTLVDNRLVKQYYFNYSTSSYNELSLLESVQECDAENNCLVPVTFNYNTSLAATEFLPMEKKEIMNTTLYVGADNVMDYYAVTESSNYVATGIKNKPYLIYLAQSQVYAKTIPRGSWGTAGCEDEGRFSGFSCAELVGWGGGSFGYLVRFLFINGTRYEKQGHIEQLYDNEKRLVLYISNFHSIDIDGDHENELVGIGRSNTTSCHALMAWDFEKVDNVITLGNYREIPFGGSSASDPEYSTVCGTPDEIKKSLAGIHARNYIPMDMNGDRITDMVEVFRKSDTSDDSTARIRVIYGGPQISAAEWTADLTDWRDIRFAEPHEDPTDLKKLKDNALARHIYPVNMNNDSRQDLMTVYYVSDDGSFDGIGSGTIKATYWTTDADARPSNKTTLDLFEMEEGDWEYTYAVPSDMDLDGLADILVFQLTTGSHDPGVTPKVLVDVWLNKGNLNFEKRAAAIAEVPWPKLENDIGMANIYSHFDAPIISLMDYDHDNMQDIAFFYSDFDDPVNCRQASGDTCKSKVRVITKILANPDPVNGEATVLPVSSPIELGVEWGVLASAVTLDNNADGLADVVALENKSNYKKPSKAEQVMSNIMLSAIFLAIFSLAGAIPGIGGAVSIALIVGLTALQSYQIATFSSSKYASEIQNSITEAGNTISLAYRLQKPPQQNLLQQIDNGLGETTHIGYKPLSDTVAYSIGKEPQNYPFVNQLPVGSPAVIDVTVDNAGIEQYPGITRHQTYWYLKGIQNVNTGFVGFLETHIRDDNKQVTTAIQRSILDASEGEKSLNLLAPTDTEVFDITANRIIQSSHSKYEVLDHDGTRSVLPVQTRSLNSLYGQDGVNVETLVNRQYRINGTLDYQRSEVSNVPQILYSCYEYDSAIGDDWWKALYPTATLVTTEDCSNRSRSVWVEGPDLSLSRTVYDYQMNPRQQSVYNNQTSSWISTNVTYNQRGQTDTVIDAVGRNTHLDYDEYGFPKRHEVSSSNGYTLSSTVTYEPKFGIKIRQTAVNDPDQVVISINPNHDIDGFGRIWYVKTATPEGKLLLSQANAYLRGPDNKGMSVKSWQRLKWDSELDWSKSESFYNTFGAKYKTVAKGPEHRIISSETLFDSLGRVSKVSAPAFSTEAKRYTTYTYDRYDKIKTVVNSNGIKVLDVDRSLEVQSDIAPYELLKTTSHSPTDAGVASSSTYTNALGKTLRSVGPGQETTNYTYDPLGRVVQVEDPAGRISVTEYNSLGQVTRRTTPAKGEFVFAYNSRGQLWKSFQNGGEISTLFQYDSMGRTTRVIADGTVKSSQEVITHYDDKGRVQFVYNEQGGHEYTYYPMGQLKTEVIAVTHPALSQATGIDTFTNSYVYSPAGVTEKTLPDGSVIRYGRGVAGELTRMEMKEFGTGDFKLFAEYSDYKASMIPGKITYGNGTSTTFKYDSLDRLAQIDVEKGTSDLFVMAYHWSDANKVKSISEMYKGDMQPVKHFEYDRKGQITSAEGSWGNRLYEYGIIGNITRIGDKTLSYDPGYRLQTIMDSSEGQTDVQFDSQGNMTIMNNPSKSTLYSYDSFNRMVEATINDTVVGKYAYGVDGNRLIKEENGTTSVYVSPDYIIAMLPDGGVLHTKYIGSVASVTRSNAEAAPMIQYNNHLAAAIGSNDGTFGGLMRSVPSYMAAGLTHPLVTSNLAVILAGAVSLLLTVVCLVILRRRFGWLSDVRFPFHRAGRQEP